MKIVFNSISSRFYLTLLARHILRLPQKAWLRSSRNRSSPYIQAARRATKAISEVYNLDVSPYPNIPGPMAALRSPMRLADRVTRRWSPRIISVLSSPSTSLRYTSESPELATSTCLSLAIVGMVHWSVRIVRRSGSPAPFPGPRSGVFKSSQKRLMRSSRMDMCALARMILSSTICGLTRA